MENIFNQGIKEAEEKYGGECRDFDRVLGAVAAIFRANGIPEADVTYVAGAWHCPLASVSGKDLNFERVKNMMFAWFDVKIPEIRIETYWFIPDLYDVSDGEVKTFLDSQIKLKFEGIRRNSKKYKELFEKNYDKAKSLLMSKKASVIEYENKIGVIDKKIKEIEKEIRDIQYVFVKIKHIEIMFGGITEKTEEMKVKVNEYVKKRQDSLDYVRRQRQEVVEFIEKHKIN